jgi:hypothetical protein
MGVENFMVLPTHGLESGVTTRDSRTPVDQVEPAILSSPLSTASPQLSFHIHNEALLSTSPSQYNNHYTPQPTFSRTQCGTASHTLTSLDMLSASTHSTINTVADRTCFEHGCDGRLFSSRSNFRRHQREKAQQARLSECPVCHAKFYRRWTRNQHLILGRCRGFRYY